MGECAESPDSSFPNLPPTNIKSVERPLDRWNGKLPIVSKRHAHTAPLEPGTSGKRLQRIGKQQREQILLLCAAQAKLLAGLAVLHGRASVLSKVQETSPINCRTSSRLVSGTAV